MNITIIICYQVFGYGFFYRLIQTIQEGHHFPQQKYKLLREKRGDINTTLLHVYIHKYVCMYGCMYVCMYVCMDACMHVCIIVCMYVHVCVYVRMYVCNVK